MVNSKLVSVINVLPAGLRRRFREYVNAPFFNKHKQVIVMTNYILDNIPCKKKELLHSSRVFSHVFPGLDKDEQKLNYLSSKLLGLLNDFLAYQEYEKNEFRRKYHSIKAAHNLDINIQEKSNIRKHRLLQNQYPFQSAELYYEKYLFSKISDQIHLDKQLRVYDGNLQLQNDELDNYYFAEKLKIACDMMSRNIVIQADYHASYAIQIVTFINQIDFDLSQHPVIHIYYQIYIMLKEQDDKEYRSLRKLIDKYYHVFLPEELILIYDYAENFCIRKINNGETSYYLDFLNIYKQKLDKKLLFVNGYLAEGDYKNIVTTGVRIKDFQWTESFIHKNKNKLKPEVQQNAFMYNLAVLYFARKQYKEALQLLMKISFKDISYGVGAKTIQMQTYYELQEFEPLINLVDTFRLYVRRHRTQSEYRKKANLNMLRIVKKVAKLREKSTFISQNQYNKEIISIRNFYASTSPLSNADWIKEIIDEL